MRDRYGVTAAGGQGRLKGKIVRIAHCGYFGAFDIVIALTALEAALGDLGADVEPGSAARRGPARLLAGGTRAGAGRLATPTMAERAKVLVKERIADAGVELLRERFDVELGLDWDEGELERRIGEFDGILIRSATQLDAGLIREGGEAARDRARRHRVWTTWTSRPPPSAESSSPTRPRPTRSRPPSTPSR